MVKSSQRLRFLMGAGRSRPGCRWQAVALLPLTNHRAARIHPGLLINPSPS